MLPYEFGHRPNRGGTPEEARGYKIGITGRWHGLDVALTWFDIAKTDILTSDPLDSGFNAPVSKLNSRGVEADISVRLACRWQVVANTAGLMRAMTIRLSPFDAGMVWYDHTFHPEDAIIGVRLGGLDDQLRPSAKIIERSMKDSIKAELTDWRPSLESPFKARAAFAREGADGMIDLLAVNALAQYGDVEAALRKIRAEEPSFQWAGPPDQLRRGWPPSVPWKRSVKLLCHLEPRYRHPARPNVARSGAGPAPRPARHGSD